jgi:hypothetical protein
LIRSRVILSTQPFPTWPHAASRWQTVYRSWLGFRRPGGFAPNNGRKLNATDRSNRPQHRCVAQRGNQPGFGLKALSGKPEGFDVEVEVGKLGIAADKITWKETISAVREDAIEKSEVDIGNQYTNA